MNWSRYQQEIFAAVSDTQDSLMIHAVAGSGKTTTILEAIKYVPDGKSVAFVAFNKSIVEELKKRVTRPGAKVMTMHAAGLNAWRQELAWDAGGLKVDSGKTRQVMELMVDEGEISKRELWKLGAGVAKLVGFAKGAGIIPRLSWQEPNADIQGIMDDSDENWLDLVAHYGLMEDEIDVDIARKVLTRSISVGRKLVDFDDMLYLPVMHGSQFEKFDVVFVDEAQDLSSLQHEMLARMVQVGGRLIAVGDPNQAIYGFRGALSQSMQQLKERFNCRALPLSVSYRCPRVVVEHVKQWVPEIESHADAVDGVIAHEGECEECWHSWEAHGVEGCQMLISDPRQLEGEDLCGCKAGKWQLEDFKIGDAILCRVNRPLVAVAFALIRMRTPARILGRDIGQGLAKLAKKLGEKTRQNALGSIFVGAVEEYRLREGEKLKARHRASQLAALDDRLDTLLTFHDETLRQMPRATVADLVAAIERLFGDNGQMAQVVTLSSVHKAKGMEWDRVFILDAGRYMPSPWAKRPWEMEQEVNLQYVAATRSKRELRYITSRELGIDERER